MLVGSKEGQFEVGDSSEPVVEGVDVNTVQVEEVEADEAIVSMCATSSNPNLSTMKLKGEAVELNPEFMEWIVLSTRLEE